MSNLAVFENFDRQRHGIVIDKLTLHTADEESQQNGQNTGRNKI